MTKLLVQIQNAWPLGSRVGVLFSARLVAAVLSIAVQLLLARLLSPDNLGLYYLATSLVTVAAVVAAGGYPNIALKVFANEGKASRRSAVFARVAGLDGLCAAVSIGCLIAAGAAVRPDGGAVMVAALALPALVGGRLLCSLAVAQERPLIANLPDLIGKPIIAALGFGWLLLSGIRIDTVTAVWVFVAATVAILVLLGIGMARLGVFPRFPPKVDRRLRNTLRKTALPLAGVSILTSFFGDVAIVVSSPFLQPAELGVFALALKIALLLASGIQAIHQVGLPRVSVAHRRGLKGEARSAVSQLNFAAIFSTAIGAGVIGLLAPHVLSLFGSAFVAGSSVIVTLVVVQVVRAYFGPSVQVLTLLSGQRTSIILSIAACLALVAGCAAFAPLYGAFGAALATGAAMILWFGSASFFAAKYGLRTAGFDVSQSKLRLSKPRALRGPT